MVIKYPSYVKMILERIENAGGEAYVVGGAVRDLLLGRAVNDYDVATSLTPEKTALLFSDCRVMTAGIKHGTVAVLTEGHVVEITTYRIDGAYADSRHPVGVAYTRCVEDDLARRDFTINAMAYNEERGLIDLFGGREDLERRLVRAVGDAERRFSEDALRIMRAFRFSSKLGFDVERETLSAAGICRHGLANISTERKTAELEGILLGKGVKKTLGLMSDVKLFDVISPGVKFDITRLDGISTLPCDLACRMAFCLVNGNDSESVKDYVFSLRLPLCTAERTNKLFRLAQEPLAFDTDKKLRRFMASCGDELFDVLKIKEALGEDTAKTVERAEEVLRRGDCLGVSSLAVGGKDVLSLGIKGRAVGLVLTSLLDAVLDEPSLNDRDTLMELAARFGSDLLSRDASEGKR